MVLEPPMWFSRNREFSLSTRLEPTIARLMRWIMTRHGNMDACLTSMSNANKDALVQAVKGRLQVEADMLDRIMLRDPDGTSLQEHLQINIGISRSP